MPLYYLPGRNGRLDLGLGVELISRGIAFTGREQLGDFARLSFQQKIECVANDLLTDFWDEEARVLAVSFGAYLFLHAQTLIPAYIGNVLLLSPIVAGATDPRSPTSFIPPRADTLLRLAKEGAYPVPRRCEIVVGEHDWQANPAKILEFAAPMGIPVTIIPNAGHVLEKEIVGKALDRFF